MNRTLLLALAGAGGMLSAAALADPDDRGYHVPNGHLPPPGECRVWQPGTPPGQQPPPTSCRKAQREADRHGGRVIYGSRADQDDRYDDDDRRDRRDGRYAAGDRPARAGNGGVLRDPSLRSWATRNFDRNRDGRLDSLELDAANLAFFRYADRNADGRLSATEFQHARLRLRG